MPLISYVPITEKEDVQLNQRIISLFVYGTVGYTVGVLASLFFKNKARIRALGAGIGAGISHDSFKGDLFYKRYHIVHGYHH